MPKIAKPVVQTIRFVKTDSSRIIFDKAVVATFLTYRQNSLSSPEAGGLLLGRHLKDGSHIAVDHVSEPMLGDKQKRNSFFRGEGHEQFAHKYWLTSNGTCAYLGSWHTHPALNPLPSKTDLHDWLNVLKNDIYEGKYLYFVIVGIQEIHCWEGSRNSKNFVKLEKYTGL
ncbi:MAG: Mov34/MPN/PAD-1 family protein [Candidatus Electrothrix sp. Rat3]|nr:Mov34/MPN/PAD-1 family protein [Candidatus Electrothrix rattekaaiensis]